MRRVARLPGRGSVRGLSITRAILLVATCATRDARWSLGEVLAHASAGEQLYPGELFGTGTLPGGSGIEHGRLLERGDTITLAIESVGALSNRIV